MSTPEEQASFQPQTPQEAQQEFERLFAEVVDLLQTTVDNISRCSGPPPRELETQIAELEAQIAAFQAMSANLITTSEEFKQTAQSELVPTIQEQASIERSLSLLEEAEQQLKNFPQEPPQDAEEFHDEKERRKRFKRMGHKRI